MNKFLRILTILSFCFLPLSVEAVQLKEVVFDNQVFYYDYDSGWHNKEFTKVDLYYYDFKPYMLNDLQQKLQFNNKIRSQIYCVKLAIIDKHTDPQAFFATNFKIYNNQNQVIFESTYRDYNVNGSIRMFCHDMLFAPKSNAPPCEPF